MELLRRVDRATHYRSPVLVGVHLTAIDELFEQGAYDEALAAAEDVIEDCRQLRRVRSEAAARAHGERARCLARLDRLDESIDEFASSLGSGATHGRSMRRWRLSLRYSLALTHRDVGELEASTSELRALVPEMAEAFGEHSTWLLSTITELATNVALDGDVPTAIEMVAAQLPARDAPPRSPQPGGAHLALEDRAMDPRRRRRRRARAAARGRRARRLHPGGLSTSAEAFELRFLFADALVECGDVDYGIAQLTSLLEDLRTSRWAVSDFTEAVTAELDEWRNVQRGGAPRE